MIEFRDFQSQVHQLTVSQKYADALAFFKENKQFFVKEKISGNVYLVADMLRCLRKTGAFEAAAKFVEIFGVSIDEHTHERILTAWALVWYDYYKSKDLIQYDDVFWGRLFTALILLAGLKTDIAANIYNLAAKLLLRTESHRRTFPAALIRRICESIDPEYLSVECHEIEIERKGNVSRKELASIREDWYVQYSKSLYITAEYELCISICNAAFEKIKKMHYSNEIWFSRRIAHCMAKQGRIDEAIRSFEKLTLKKGDWFMIAELASLYRQSGNNDKALVLMHRAMCLPGELKFKIELIGQIAEMYELKNELSLAGDHRYLTWLIMKIEQWRPDPRLTMQVGTDCSEQEAGRLIIQLQRKLQKIWSVDAGVAEKKSLDGKQLKSGKIMKTGIPKEQGTDVWILADHGERLYGFIKRETKLHKSISLGLRVRFTVLAAHAGKLNIASNIIPEN